MTYEYDDWGNLTEKNVYAYTTAENPGTPTDTKTYDYDNTDWGDQLTGYDGQTIEYEPVIGIRGLLLGYAGNPISYLGRTLSWHGRELVGITDGTDTISYIYDSNGLRQKKTVNGTDTNYYYNGSVLIGMQQGTNALRFSYDAAGAVAAVDFNGTYYYYVRNGQGDIVKLIDGSRNTVVEYAYDSWGKLLSCTGTLATTLGTLNPFRYRGYVYDSETGFYYLKSRYYDPETCRFISADVLLSTGQGVLGHNCYAYCGNQPISRLDTDGHSWSEIWEILKLFFTETSKGIASKSHIYALCGGAALVDGPLPFGDMAGAAAAFLLFIGTVGYSIYQTVQAQPISISKADKDVQAIPLKPKKPVIFPVNPYDFHPLGLVRVERPGTKNGRFISWVTPGEKGLEIYRWDENINHANGPHYHVKGFNYHFRPGVDAVPEPFASISFPLS